MSASLRARALAGVAAGLTVTALIAATINVPASATPIPPIPTPTKLKLPDGTAASRVIPGRYLVETVATPLSRGGSRLSNQSASKVTASATTAAGAKVGTSYSELWSGVSVTATEAQIRVIAQSPSVKAVYPVLRVDLPNTTKSATSVSSALDQISALGVAGQDGTGIKVGVIDTGIDYNNPDLGGGSSFPTTRVAYGYDFVGDAYNGENTAIPDANPDDCEGHGTHVAGIIGASGSGDGDSTTGVAPNATLGAYRVFGCEGGTDTDIILKALTKAKADKMDVVNLSLGSDFDSWPSYPDAVAVANLAKAGVVVAVAAGNSGDTGLFSAGSPAVGAGVISVASYEGETIKSRAISVGGAKYAYTAVDGTSDAPADNSTTLELKVASNLEGCTAISAVGPDTALLIKRGTCDFRVKVQNAIAAGAKAAVIYNNVPGLDSFTAVSETDPVDLSIPAISIGGTQGQTLAAALTSVTPIDPTMTWMSVQADLVNPDAGQISTFSSAGLAADLSLVPTIAAPGAKIYSTLPVEEGGHGNLSGTSMATPFIAGTAAVMLQVRPTLKGHPADLSKLLYNTAAPVMKNTELNTAKPEGVFRQGSGLVNLTRALAAKVTASPSTIKLGDGTSQTVTISLSNKTASTLTYKVARISGVSAAASTSGGNEVGTTTPIYGWSDAGFKASKTVKVKAGKTVKVKVKISAPNPSVLKGKAGMLYGGWVQFTTTGGGNTVTVPFAGLRGDYQSVKVLNKFKYNDGETAWSLPSLGYVDDEGYIAFETGEGRNYTMVGDDVPFAIYHLDYPASDVQLKITNQGTKKSYYAILDDSTYDEDTGKISSKSTHLYKESRDAGAQVIPLVGLYYKGKAYNVPDGTWKMQLRVLKPLGSSSKSKYWETWTSRTFTIG